MSVRRFENVNEELGISKFWSISEPHVKSDTVQDTWLVSVRYGRIGSEGKELVHTFLGRQAAFRFVAAKINEKRGRAYIEVFDSFAKKALAVLPIQGFKPPIHPAQDFNLGGPPKVCTHDTMRKVGGGFQCLSCKTEIRFEGRAVDLATPKFAQDVARHIELED